MIQQTTNTQETKILLRIALPLVAAYLAEMAMFITTKIVVGELGYLELAAAGIAGNLSHEIAVILMGMLSIVGVLCAAAEGAGEKREAGLAVRQGLLISLWVGIPATLVVWNLDYVLLWTGQDPKVIELAGPYLHYLSGFLLPILFFAVLRNFVAALARPTIVMLITVVAVLLNYLLTRLLVFGGMGIAPMGLAGAGLATTLVNWMMFFALLWYVYRTASLRGYGVFSERWKVQWPICRDILVLGLPVAGLVTVEAGMFSAASILSGVISAETLAAYEVVMSWSGIPFMIALGISEAAMVRVAYGVGQGSMPAARRSGMLSMGLGIFILTFLMIVPLGLADQFIGIFLSPTDPGYELVAPMAASFLVISVIFQVFDGLQAIAARALRGLRDSVAPLLIASMGYWVFGIGGGAWLAFGLELGGAGIWWGLAMGLTITGSLLAWRFHRFTAA